MKKLTTGAAIAVIIYLAFMIGALYTTVAALEDQQSPTITKD